MRMEEEYRLSQYQDLGVLDGRSQIRLKRHQIYGHICVEKRVPVAMECIYQFMQQHHTPYIPRIYECIVDGDMLIIIEEYIEGRNLEEITREQLIHELEAVRILLQLCNALKSFHHAEPVIICRDLKAENVMIDQSGNVKIVDFNIARTYQNGKNRDTRLLGTAEYAAPEQYGYFQTDNRTDIYALGVLFNYIMLRKFPVEQMSTGRSAEIIKKCTYLDPKERYQSVEELEHDLIVAYPQYNTSHEKRKEDTMTRSFLPPGFRTKTLWKMFVAILGYLLIAYFCFTMEAKDEGVPITGVRLRIEQSLLWVSQMGFVFFACNYRGWKDNFSLINNKNLMIKIVMHIVAYVTFLLWAAIVAVIVSRIFFS